MPDTTSSLDGCDSARLRDLLDLALEPDGAVSSLAAELGDARTLGRLLTELLGDEATVEATVAGVVSPDTPVGMLRSIKELAQRRMESADPGNHRNAAAVLYHCAVAAGYAHHGMNLSSRPIESRLALYEDLAAVFSGHPLAVVLRAAVDRDRRQSDTKMG